MYFDINRPIDYDLQKMQTTLMHANVVGIVFAVENNARSTSWHDVLTNKRGKTMQEYLISRQLHIANQESCHTMLCANRGTSNIEKTIQNNQAISLISGWAIKVHESCSDHIIKKYDLSNANATIQPTGNNRGSLRYRVEQRNIAKFPGNLIQMLEQLLSGTNKEQANSGTR